MMTLLKACGEILSLCNKKMYGLINRYLCGDGDGCVGQEALSLLTMILFFIAFMAGEDIIRMQNIKCVSTPFP